MTTTRGSRILKVNHAGENGAVNIYRAQIVVSRFSAPHMTDMLREFLSHEVRHRALFWERLQARRVRRCRSYLLCGLGGFALGLFTAMLGGGAIAATTHAVESVVLEHLERQMAELRDQDPTAYTAIADIVADEREHHDHSKRLTRVGFWPLLISPIVRASTEAVIWLGMRL
ncbi:MULTISPECIES: demethoxyubiquinone hydroxylase family protein [unclassified Pseudoxanthomonas]|uniref:demethoxyubiquinone hydroxylase family protein n=1 Tax=unclassified Pseudoxanthomonas TaxID=2645906 RepID=UPI00307760B3